MPLLSSTHPRLSHRYSFAGVVITDAKRVCGRELLRYVRDLWKRGNPDDIQLLLLTVINAYLAEVPLLQNLRAQVQTAASQGRHRLSHGAK